MIAHSYLRVTTIGNQLSVNNCLRLRPEKIIFKAKTITIQNIIPNLIWYLCKFRFSMNNVTGLLYLLKRAAMITNEI